MPADGLGIFVRHLLFVQAAAETLRIRMKHIALARIDMIRYL